MRKFCEKQLYDDLQKLKKEIKYSGNYQSFIKKLIVGISVAGCASIIFIDGSVLFSLALFGITIIFMAKWRREKICERTLKKELETLFQNYLFEY